MPRAKYSFDLGLAREQQQPKLHTLLMSFPDPIPSSATLLFSVKANFALLFPNLLQLYFPPDAFVLVHSQPQVSSTNASMPPVIVDGCWELKL